jgi:ribosome-associated toxin RatA of RatAB toxin-antitoxin module
MPHIHHKGAADAPLSVLFAYVDDASHTVDWLFGLSRFDPNTEQLSGLGATYDGTFSVKPIKLHSSVRITEWELDKVIALESYKGFQIASQWHFSSTGSETSTVEVDFEYELPGGLAGRAMAKAFEPIVALSIRHSDESLRKNVAAVYAASRE